MHAIPIKCNRYIWFPPMGMTEIWLKLHAWKGIEYCQVSLKFLLWNPPVSMLYLLGRVLIAWCNDCKWGFHAHVPFNLRMTWVTRRLGCTCKYLAASIDLSLVYQTAPSAVLGVLHHLRDYSLCCAGCITSPACWWCSTPSAVERVVWYTRLLQTRVDWSWMMAS